MADVDGSSPGSTFEHSEMDERMATQASSPIRADPRNSLQHVLGDTESQTHTPSATRQTDLTEDDEARTPAAQEGPKPTSRKRRDGAASILANPGGPASGNKIKHLKKDDGEPLWRKDIQYDFLRAIFHNEQAVFTNSYEPPGSPLQTFSQLYIDAMARSSKTSKILRDKLLTEHEPARNMAMVCLLVNLGRMNTTLNFFPEMRAQLRTYHAIPCLQAHQDPNSYKQLQDAPRLKSILKGASEDRVEPNTLDKIKDADIPRTNPVNLIFVLAQFAPRITELHFPTDIDFFDLIMKTSLSSTTRATAFLWLMWFYLESDFTEEGADENPFGAGVDYDLGVRNQGVPRFTHMSREDEDKENVDTEEEQSFGYAKMRERKRIIEADQAAFQSEQGPPKRGPKPKLHLPPEDGSPFAAGEIIKRMRAQQDLGPSPGGIVRMRPKYESDMDSTRSTPPPRGSVGGARLGSGLGRGRGARLMESSPIAPGEPASVVRRSRPLTAHQLAVERNRNQRVDCILSRGLRKSHHHARKARRKEGVFWRTLQRMNATKDLYDDSEGEDHLSKEPLHFRERGFVGLVQLETEDDDDFGEEFSAYASAFRRMGRRLDRWDLQPNPELSVKVTNRASHHHSGTTNGRGANRNKNDETEDDRSPQKSKRAANGDANMDDEEDLDDMDKAILGLGSENEDESDRDEELDDVDRELLAIAGDDTDDDMSEGGMDVD